MDHRDCDKERNRENWTGTDATFRDIIHEHSKILVVGPKIIPSHATKALLFHETGNIFKQDTKPVMKGCHYCCHPLFAVVFLASLILDERREETPSPPA